MQGTTQQSLLTNDDPQSINTTLPQNEEGDIFVRIDRANHGRNMRSWEMIFTAFYCFDGNIMFYLTIYF